jgi:hypothetical protein
LIAIVAADYFNSAEQPALIAQLGLYTAILWRKWQVQMDGGLVKMAIRITALIACVTPKI